MVTGGAGFIGSALCRHLINDLGHHVVNVDKMTYAATEGSTAMLRENPSYRFHRLDICDRDAMQRLMAAEDIDGVIHLAAESHVDRSIDGPGAFVETNVIGTFSLLQAGRSYHDGLAKGRKEKFRFHHVSTDEVFGELPLDGGLFTEDTAYAPSSPYSASKAASDHLVMAWHKTYGLPVVLSNCSNNYGSHQFPEKLLPLMINNIMHSKPLPVYGKGENVRDWLWVEDHARAIDIIFHKGIVGETYNIGGFNEWKNIDIVHLLCRIMDKKLNRAEGESEMLITYVKDRAGHDKRYAIDATKLEKELGWSPSLQFEEGLEKTIDWYLTNETWVSRITSGSYKQYYDQQYTKR